MWYLYDIYCGKYNIYIAQVCSIFCKLTHNIRKIVVSAVYIGYVNLICCCIVPAYVCFSAASSSFDLTMFRT